MGRTLRLLFNLHPGDGRRAGLFIILGLLWSVGSYGTFVLSEGMFLEHVGAHALPKVYLAIAVSMCLLSAILILSLNRLSIRFLLFFLISTWILTNLTFFFLYPSCQHTDIYWYLFKIVGWIIPISTYIVYWAFADQYYDLQDGKRFFCLFNSITFLGDALGGGIISSFLDWAGVPSLMLFFTLSMCASLPFIFLITRRLQPILEEHIESIDTLSSVNLKTIFQTIFNSRFTLYLIGFYFVMQLLAIITEFNYMESFERTFADSIENSLTVFISSCGMWISLGNMLFGMFFYSRLVKKMGVNNIILVAPSFFLTILSIWYFKDALPLAIFGLIAREGMVYSFDDNNLNLLLSGVPNKVKNQVRICVESFIEPTGMLAGAALLFLFKGNPRILGITISVVAIVFVLFLRQNYPKAIFRNLVASAIRFEKTTLDFLRLFSTKEQKRAEFALLSNLKVYDEKGQLIAYEYLLKIGHPRILPRLLNHIGKLSLPGKLKAIDLLSESGWAKETIVLERLDRWRRILPHPAIKSAIHFYLARHGVLRPERIMHDLHNDHIGLRAAAILALKTTPHAFQFPSFYSLASEKLRDLLDSQQEYEVCIGLQILGFEKDPASIEYLIPYLEHSELCVNRAAAKSLAMVAHSDYKAFAPQIISQLKKHADHEVRIGCLKALEILEDPNSIHQLLLAALHLRPPECKFIERTVLKLENRAYPTLFQIVQDSKIPDRCRLLAGKILGKSDRKALQKQLYTLVKREIKRAYFYFYHANCIQRQVPEHDLSILQKALFTSYYSIIDFIIQLLGTAGSIEESEILSHTLRSQNRKIRAQAVESLEKACDSRLFDLIEPLIDERHFDEKISLYLKTGGIPLNLTQLLDVLGHSSSRADQIISIAMKARLKTPDWRSTLHEKLQNGEEIFHHFAYELLEV